MDESSEHNENPTDNKHVLPDVVHSQQIHASEATVPDEKQSSDLNTLNVDNENSHDIADSKTESISECLPSKIEYSTESDVKSNQYQGLLKVESDHEKLSRNSSLNIPLPLSSSDNPSQDVGRQSASWPADVHHISEESPVNLALSSDLSKDDVNKLDLSENKSHESLQSDQYLDSLNEESNKSASLEANSHEQSNESYQGKDSLENFSSGSEEIIKLDIREHDMPKFPISTSKVILGPPPEGSTIIEPECSQIPLFPPTIPPFLVGATTINVDKLFTDDIEAFKQTAAYESPEKLQSEPESLNKLEQNDLLVEEVMIDEEYKEKDCEKEEMSIPTQPKSFAPDESTSFSTLTTDYKTICEEYHAKLVHLEDAINQRDELIEELTISLQKSIEERDHLKSETSHLTKEIGHLQHLVAESSDHDTVKGQLSDLVKYQTMINDSTKFYSAVVSGASSVRSSNGEKDMEHEEITINYSRSDLKSSEEFETGFESKVAVIINKFEESIEENLRNQLRESIIQVLCDEICKMRLDYDAEIKDVENRAKQEYTGQTRKLRELLSSVKTGNAEVEALRDELAVKHKEEMENLRKYFEQKCSDMERSYSEDIYRGRACVSPPGGGPCSLDMPNEAGDYLRTRPAELHSLPIEHSTPLEGTPNRRSKLDRQLEELKLEHTTSINEKVRCLEDQVAQLKAQLQAAEHTESNVLYQQDIDLELEKDARFQEKVEEVRQEVIQQLQEQMQVLLSDPDAELSSWPLELVALREKIHGEAAKAQQEKELSSLRDELSGETDKWKQKRNICFDQNRHLEKVTKERDGLKRVAVSLHSIVSQLVAYCAACEDELNKTVLQQLLAKLVSSDETFDEDSRPCSPNQSKDLNVSLITPTGKHVHFAPDLNNVLSQLDEEGVATYLQQQHDVSADIRLELEVSLARLRSEAHELLQLSNKLTKKGVDTKMLESSDVQISELVEGMEFKHKSCDNCELHRRNMEEAMAECLQREKLLRSDLEAAMMKIAHLMTSDRMHSTDLIAEGYGTQSPVHAVSLPGRLRAASPRSPRSPPSRSPREPASPTQELARDLDLMHRERDDLQQQLEAANRQLRSTRAFLSEQQAEREAERDDAAGRLRLLAADNARLAASLQANARILAEVEQLENQAREMNDIISDLETRNSNKDKDLKAANEKVTLLRDIIANLENQLEQKVVYEKEILEELEKMKNTIDERDNKLRALLGELESLKSEKVDNTDVMCTKCSVEENKYEELVEKIRDEAQWLEDKIHRRTQHLERAHEVCSTSCSEPSEDVSIRDQRKHDNNIPKSPSSPPTPRRQVEELSSLYECLSGLVRAEDAALKRIVDLHMQREQLTHLAQEVRAERDVLQARMSEQALKISSLSARLDQQRNNAHALAHQATSDLSVQLHDALAEVQRLKEELDGKEKQMMRLKQSLEERDKLSELHQPVYGNSCNPKDKVIILERELSNAQMRLAQLENLVRSLENDKDELQSTVRDLTRTLAEKEEQLQELMALKLDEEQKEEKSDILEGGKTSARTLSDIVSISDFDEQDHQMRRAEMKTHNLSLSGAPYNLDIDNKTLNRTLPPDVHNINMSSLNIEYIDKEELNFSPRADSLPGHLTSTQNKDVLKHYKRNVNETTVFGVDKFGNCAKSPARQMILDNCSMHPNRDISDGIDKSVEPKKINFSLEASNDNKVQGDNYISLSELGINPDVKQENFPDILTQLKYEIKKSKIELDNCKSELKNAEEQLCEFPALKEEVEELKRLLENTMATMDNDKKFYENQLENFTSNKKLLEQRLSELTQELTDKSKDLHVLKEDILRRENMILELAKEKRNLTNKLAELEVKIDEIQSRNNLLQKYESENVQIRDRVAEFNKLEQLVSEKNQQIDSLNQHLDRLDDLQRCLNDKTEEFDNLKEAYEEKTNELDRLHNTVDTLKRDIAAANGENDIIILANKELKLKLTKLEKEQENSSLKLQNSESELERVNSMNTELTLKIEELKSLTDKLKDKETELEILQEDINSYHDEIASLKEQLKMASRSPSPRSKNGEERKTETQPGKDKVQLVKIRKQISLLQHELDFNRKELNDKAFELAKARLDVTELRNNLNIVSKQMANKDMANLELGQQVESLRVEVEQLREEKEKIGMQLQVVMSRIREEANIEELKSKLKEKAERCEELENELLEMKILVQRTRSPREVDGFPFPDTSRALVAGGARSPTAELERAVRDELDVSHALDENFIEQILSASSDEHESIPRLILNTSKSSSLHSSSSDRVNRLRSDNDKLQMQVNNLEARLKDKDALITELNRIRDKLVQDWQATKLKYESERDNAGRLQLLLHTQRETAESLQNQDSNMIAILKKRLECSMQAELELQERTHELQARVASLGAASPTSPGRSPQTGDADCLKNEVSILRSRLESEKTRSSDLQAILEQHKLHYSRELDAKTETCNLLRNELAELKRLKHDAGIELLRAKELLNIQTTTIQELEKKLSASSAKHPSIQDALTEIETHKSELAREIASLKQCLTPNAEVANLKQEKRHLAAKVEQLEKVIEGKQSTTQDDKDHALRYLHGRCLRLESCRKALVWQKRYLQRVLAGYAELERTLALTPAAPSAHSSLISGKRRFKRAATLVLAVLRMRFLVKKRVHVRALSAAAILRTDAHSRVASSPGPFASPSRPAALARKLYKQDLRLNLQSSPGMGDFVTRSQFSTSSPQHEQFLLNSPRDASSAYFNRLELVSRCLNQAMDASRDVP